MSDEEAPIVRSWDRWRALAALSPARIGLGRAGAGARTEVHLAFQAAHAAARDAVHIAWDPGALRAALGGIEVASPARDRQTYLLRPDLGRLIADETALVEQSGDWDVVIVVTNGLSTEAVERHAQGLVTALQAALSGVGLRLAPLVSLRDGRVAAGDPIARAIGARLVVMIVGERPGLSAADSLGIYVTLMREGALSDADRNCISNVHPPAGLGYDEAAAKCTWLVRAALGRGYSGVQLKDESGTETLIG